jgi:hypothetical protein
MCTGEGRRLHRDGSPADHASRHEHAQLVMPLGPVDGEEGGLAPLRDHAQQWRCKPLISDALMAQQPIEPGQRTAHLDPNLGGYSLAISNLSHDNTLKTQGISYSNAEGGTRTPTGCPTTPSRWRVYQVPPLRHELSASASREHPPPPDRLIRFGVTSSRLSRLGLRWRLLWLFSLWNRRLTRPRGF